MASMSFHEMTDEEKVENIMLEVRHGSTVVTLLVVFILGSRDSSVKWYKHLHKRQVPAFLHHLKVII